MGLKIGLPFRGKFDTKAECLRFLACVVGCSYAAYQIGFSTLLTTIIGPNSIDTMISIFFAVCVILYAYTQSSSMVRKKAFLALFSIGLIVGWCMFFSVFFMGTSISTVSNIAGYFYRRAIWGFFYVYLLNDDKLWYKVLRVVAYISFFSLVLEPFAGASVLFNQVSTNSWGSNGYLMWGQRVVIPVVMLLYFSIKEKKKFDIIISIVGVFELLFIGNRGSILVIAVFLILYIVLNASFVNKIKYGSLTIVLSGVIMYLFRVENLYRIQMALHKYGVESRTITKFLDGSLTDTGREYAYELSIRTIRSGNWFGLGIGGDQELIGNYPHNFIYEILLQYGNLIGGVFLLILTSLFLKKMVFSKETLSKEILLVLFCISVLRLMTSSSYLYEPWFFVFLGYLFHSGRHSTYNYELMREDT